ncbi:rhamnogalacturonan acetylesterase [Uliginosibacterium gangwonense]|uniref:rhamnogalacturonan acetylesterase n=1 Tax=Uliginosibacterium gangwonense TaxID=392736 RepID=UPI000361BE59|nr:rhamnogalacturonan acetylesterase [Uliginosibacterium gangwonense]
MKPTRRLSLTAVLVASLMGCASQQGSAPATYTLSGVVGNGNKAAQVTVFDARGKQTLIQTNAQGQFSLRMDGLSAPLMLVAQTADKQYVAISTNPAAGEINVNALTDRIASDLALEAKFKGPAGLAQSAKAPAVTAETVAAKTAALRASIATALKEARVSDVEHFDPVTVSMGKEKGVYDLLSLIKHNRGYSSASGEQGETSLYDPRYREITRFHPLSLSMARMDTQALLANSISRVFIAGDSTASNYDPEVAPRMGWGQAFDRQIKIGSPIQVINVAQSGRSSRSFINEGWFGMIAADIRKGDYLLIQFGHNDEKCGNEPPAPPPARDQIDTAKLCTYPGNNPAVPAEMSFQKTLEKYIAMARQAGATPVLITPVTRRSFKGGEISTTTHTYGKGKFPGDYSQTIRDTAQANKVALVDLDARSMAFFSKIGEQGSLDYYLAVDPAQYPYYANTTGNRNKPDNTHFQEKGAEAVSGLVAEGIKEAALPLADYLK